MSEKFDKLTSLLKELFQLDQPDLDFGLYRIIHAKAAEVTQFLDEDLLPQVKEAFSQYRTADKVELEKELAKVIVGVEAAGLNPDDSPKVKELRERIKDDATDLDALENEVYDYLFSFFRRYYSEGDFLAKRVYKRGVYAIPYEGEEIKLYWANDDQYYIKTDEYLRDYAFRLRPESEQSPMRVHFRLVDAAEGEHGNVKPANGNDRIFVLAAETFIAEENGELVIRFEYRPATLTDWPDDGVEGKTKPPTQKEMTALAVQRVLEMTDPVFAPWTVELGKQHIGANAERADYSRLEAHLRRYTARNTFDYFIHKDVGGFLRQELDFYIKNEIMHLDDIENERAPRVEQYLSKIKVIRRIARKIIDFLAQLEDFQKKLWLKKKFVVETNYCITLDRIPEEYYPHIASNEAQREEWVKLFSIDQTTGDLVHPRYQVPLTSDFLKAHDTLVVDTCFFEADFVAELLARLDIGDKDINGILVHSDNFQALLLMEKRFREQVKCVYIDPPYNTASSAILYKNDYKHSSFATMMNDRLSALREVMRKDGAIFVSIDKTERAIVQHVLDSVFGQDNHIEELIWTQSTANSQLPNYSTNHEYVEVYARDRAAVEADADMFREPKPGYAEIVALVRDLNPTYPSVASIESSVKTLFKEHIAAFKDEIEASGREWDAENQKLDPWKGIYNYCRAEYRDSEGRFLPEDKAKTLQAAIWIWREISPSAPASKQSATTRDPNHYNFRYYKPPHPTTGKACPHPKGGWKFPFNPDPTSPARRSFVDLDRDKRIAWGDDETKVPQTKGFLHEVETNIGTSVFYEYNDGEAEVGAMFGRSGVFLSPKSSRFVQRFISQATRKDDFVLDAFGGSGSTGHAVVAQNRIDGGNRKYVLMEVGRHFDEVLKPRMLKAIFSSRWKDGSPSERDGQSHCFKYLRLESYEDALNNLTPRRTNKQQLLLDTPAAHGMDGFTEQYLLHYMLDIETRGSQSLLNVKAFADPTAYRLWVKKPGSDETREVDVDLLETFNWLIGLVVQNIALPQGFTAEFERDSEKRLRLKGRLKQDAAGPWWFRTVTGTIPDGRRTLVIWRKLTDDSERDNLVLDEWFMKRGYSTKDYEFLLIYVNGDCNLENLKAPDDTWKVRLIEEDFHRLMFDTEGV